MNRDLKPNGTIPHPRRAVGRSPASKGSPARRKGKRGTGRGQGNLAAILSSKWSHWTSPPKFLERLAKLGRPALDPCSNFHSRTGALREWWGNHHAVEDLDAVQLELASALAAGRHVELRNGLVESWQGFVSFVYWNPPYGAALPGWLKKGADEGAAGVESVGLFPARTDTVAMHEQVFQRATAGCFWRGRINFDNPPPAPEGVEDWTPPGGTFPPFVAYHGRRVDEFFAAFDGAGELVRLNTPRHQEDDHADR